MIYNYTREQIAMFNAFLVLNRHTLAEYERTINTNKCANFIYLNFKKTNRLSEVDQMARCLHDLTGETCLQWSYRAMETFLANEQDNNNDQVYSTQCRKGILTRANNWNIVAMLVLAMFSVENEDSLDYNQYTIVVKFYGKHGMITTATERYKFYGKCYDAFELHELIAKTTRTTFDYTVETFYNSRFTNGIIAQMKVSFFNS